MGLVHTRHAVCRLRAGAYIPPLERRIAVRGAAVLFLPAHGGQPLPGEGGTR